MQSHLTRSVFRQLTRNQALTHAQLTRQSYVCHEHQPRTPCLMSRMQSRSLFWMGGEKSTKRTPKEPDFDPGFADLIELGNMLRIRARPPPRPHIAGALTEFFTYKTKSRTPIVDRQMKLCLTAFRFLQEGKSKDQTLDISSEVLFEALKKLGDDGQKGSAETTVELARLIYKELREQNYEPATESAAEAQANPREASLLHRYLQVLSHTGRGSEIKNTLQEGLLSGASWFSSSWLWFQGLKAFIREKNEGQLNNFLELMERNNIQLAYRQHVSVVKLYVEQNDFVAAKKWYTLLRQKYDFVAGRIHSTMLNMCIANRDPETGNPIVERILEDNPRKYEWDIILKWAVLKEQSLDDIDRMMDVQLENCSDIQKHPDTETMNGLIELAYSMGSPSLAQGFSDLAATRNVVLDGTTYMLRMEHCLKAGDLPGAQEAWREAQQFEVPFDKEVSLLNWLVRSLYNPDLPGKENNAVFKWVNELVERKGGFEPETVVILTGLHLQRDELVDAIDLLQTHAHNFGSTQRASIQSILVDTVKDRSKTPVKIWEAYQLLREIFPETDVSTRRALMNEFFDRGRPDMGMHAFGHMRQASESHHRPTADIYVECLAGIARYGDEESLELVHNMLKLDSEVEPSTRLRNALMIGYLNCGSPVRALEFWDEIAYSPEGPTYNSICIALRVCEGAPFGDEHAGNIWRRLQKFEVEITPEIYAAYVGALSGQGMVEQAIEAIGNMERVVGVAPNALTIGSFFNATRQQVKRVEAFKWANTEYPKVWAELEELGMNETGNFKIDRRLIA